MDGPGRPTLYKPEFAEQAYDLCLMGATNQDLADCFEVSRSTIDKWLRREREFAQTVRRGRDLADAEVARALYSRAVGFSYQATKVLLHRGEPVFVPVTVYQPPHVGAGMFWLRNRRPDLWRRDDRRDDRRLQAASRQARDVGPADGELAHHGVIAPVEMVEAAEPGLAASAECGDDKGGGSAHVAAGHGRAVQAIDAADQRGPAAHSDAGAHPGELVDVTETLLENRLGDGADAGRRRQQRHRRRLQVGGKAG